VRPRRSLSRRSSSSHLTVGGYVIAETVVIRAKTEAEEDAMSGVGQGEMPGEDRRRGTRNWWRMPLKDLANEMRDFSWKAVATMNHDAACTSGQKWRPGVPSAFTRPCANCCFIAGKA